MNNIGLDVASQFGDHQVIIKYEKPKEAKDISFIYGERVRPGTELVTQQGTATKVKDIRTEGQRTVVTVVDAKPSKPVKESTTRSLSAAQRIILEGWNSYP